ncbi:MAG: 2OG-Fe(II) oxygenase [Armatimonadetes bacterium]|nr:2OG-Fe(II) oxygenase [Armatimonadota bacterium]
MVDDVSGSVSVLCIGRKGPTLTRDQAVLDRVRRHFADARGILLRGWLAEDLTRQAQEVLEDAAFQEKREEGIGLALRMVTNGLARRLEFLHNTPTLYRAVEQLTGCGSVGSFAGRIVQLPPGTNKGYGWHSDATGDRNVGLSLNLGSGGYSGGVFQVRERRSGRICWEVDQLAPGDALLFRIDPELEHQVTPVEAGVPRTVYSGWFSSRPGLWSRVHQEVRAGAGD